MRRWKPGAAISFLLLLGSVIVPFGVSLYATRVWTVAMMNAILAMSLSMSIVIAGVVSMGQAGFYAIGAYTAAVLSTRLGMGAPWTLLFGGVLAALAGILLAAPSLRLRGMYFMLTTMAFGEIVRLVALNWTGLTHGPMGIAGVQGITIFGRPLSVREYYWTTLLVAVICYYFCEFISRSDYGLACKSMRDDDLAASVLGMNVPVLRISAAALACFWAGIVGALYAHLSLTILVISMLGSLLGPVFSRRASYIGTFVSAIVLTWLLEGLRFLQEYRMAFYGLFMLLLVVFQPQVQALARSLGSHFSGKERTGVAA
jgi:branched-chain amino acid transport system permease protein